MPRTGSEPGPLPEAFPWSREREVMEALERLDLPACRERLGRLAQELRTSPELSLRTAAFLLADLLSRLRQNLTIVRPLSDPAERRERLRLASGLTGATEIAGLRSFFLQEADRLIGPAAEGAGLSPAVMRARAFLDRHYARRVSLGEVARSVHLSPNYLSSLFRREVGVTMTAYVRSCRMRQAERLLLEGRHTISEVAYRVGYQNYRDFHRNFVRATGRSPRSFRRREGHG